MTFAFAVVVVVLVVCVVAAVVSRAERFDCGYSDCDQRNNPWHRHERRRR